MKGSTAGFSLSAHILCIGYRFFKVSCTGSIFENMLCLNSLIEVPEL